MAAITGAAITGAAITWLQLQGCNYRAAITGLQKHGGVRGELQFPPRS
jgi:hypothetical protein